MAPATVGRSLRSAALFATFALACACARKPLPAQQTGSPAMQQAVDALTRALKEKNFEVLSPYLDDAFHVDQISGDFARSTLRQVVTGGMRTVTAIDVDSVAQRGGFIHASTRFTYADGSKPVELVLTPAGKFVELPFFHVSMSGSPPPAGAAPGGIRYRAGPGAPGGGAPPMGTMPGAGGPVANPALRDELLAMKEEDQRYRRMIINGTAPGARPTPDPETLRLMNQADAANLARLVAILERHGWPGTSMVGQDASVAAFLILQHADPAVQEKYLPLVRQAAERREIYPGLLATLEDRVRMHHGQAQLYGTQLHENPATHRMELWKVEDEARVDERRASVGLPPLADYLRHMGIEYTPPARP